MRCSAARWPAAPALASACVALALASACKGGAPRASGDPGRDLAPSAAPSPVPEGAGRRASSPEHAGQPAPSPSGSDRADSSAGASDTPGARGLARDLTPPGCDLSPNPLRHPAPARLVAIGDVHGDLAAARAALRLAGAIDADDRWAGGDLVVVQTGDFLDRGDDEQAIVDLLVRLRREAREAGGALHVLSGNHELMNADGDLRYVTAGGFTDFADAPGVEVAPDDPALARLPASLRPRAAAFLPGGPYARLLAEHNVVVIVGDTVFAHGGVEPAYAEYGLDRLNRETRCWLRGDGPRPAHLGELDGPTWSRAYSRPPEACDALAATLDALGAARMVVAHTPQPGGINAACDGKVWRIDTGMSAFYGGPVQVLELRGGTPRALSAP